MTQTRPTLRQAVCWALVLSSMISTPVLSAQTDISSSPITSTNAAQVKPNVMLLMDTSGSMGWGHMPDEVETQVGHRLHRLQGGAVQRRLLQPQSDLRAAEERRRVAVPDAVVHERALRRLLAFDGAPTATVDLSSAFKAYDDTTLRTSGYNDTPQPAYYYYKTGGTVPITGYNSTPCTDDDVSMTVPSSDGGTWNRRRRWAPSSGVGGTDERQNFAIWYSYYRTRILLIKSAASLAFTPLTDSFRVGFITVKPKDNPTDAAINAEQVPGDRRLQHDAARPVVRQALLAGAGRLVADARRPGAGRAACTRASTTASTRAWTTTRCSTRASRTSRS